MYNFLPVLADKKEQRFENNEYLPHIFALFDKYNNVLLDDYYSSDSIGRMLEIVELLNRLYPHFYAIVISGEFAGFVYLSDWRGGKGNYHSCTITTAFEKKFWGIKARNCGKAFLKKVFAEIGVKKLKAEVFEHNLRVKNYLKALGFEFEGVLRQETWKNGRGIDVLQFRCFS